jgi:hypothetical protein
VAKTGLFDRVISNTNHYDRRSIGANFDTMALSKFEHTPMMLTALLKKSLLWLFGIALSLTISTSATANSPKPPSLYWLKFDPPTVQSVQIAQCQDKDCQKSILLGQHGTCTEAGCLKPTQSQLLKLDCADNLCLVALPPFYDKNELDPARTYIVAQLDNRVWTSKIFTLVGRKDSSDKFTVKVVGNKLEIVPNPDQIVTDSPIFQNLFFISLILTLGIELIIWGGSLRWKQMAFSKIRAILVSVFFIHTFSFPIVWFSFPGLQHFASQSMRCGGLAWLGFSILYGTILSLYLKWAKNPLSALVEIGSVSYWLGAVFVSVVTAALLGYGSPLPDAAGLSEPIAILASEIFVIGYEAWIIQRLRHDNLKFKTALGLSFAANTASCLIGLAVSLFALR